MTSYVRPAKKNCSVNPYDLKFVVAVITLVLYSVVRGYWTLSRILRMTSDAVGGGGGGGVMSLVRELTRDVQVQATHTFEFKLIISAKKTLFIQGIS